MKNITNDNGSTHNITYDSILQNFRDEHFLDIPLLMKNYWGNFSLNDIRYEEEQSSILKTLRIDNFRR